MTFSRRLLLPSCLLLAALFAIVNWLYWPYVSSSGVLNPNADSVGIPMFSGLLLSPVLALVFSLWATPALIGAKQQVQILAWNSRKPWRSAIGTLAYGGVAALTLFAIISLFSPDWQLFDALWVAFLGPLLIWNLMLRAAFVDWP